MIYLEEQLTLIRHLQEWRGPVFDAVLRFLNFLDTFTYYNCLVSFIWVGISWKWGVRLGMVLIVNGLVNAITKIAFAMPRPFYYDSLLAIVQVEGFSFPSGGAQTAMLFGVLLIHYWKSHWAWPCGVFYILLVSFSRIALGVHFVLDVLGGWALGLIIAALFIYAVRPLEQVASRHPQRMLMAIAIPTLLTSFFLPYKLMVLTVSAFITVLGVYLSTRYGLYITIPRIWWKRLLHGMIAIVGAGLLGYVAKTLGGSSLVEWIVEGLWVTLIASPLCKRVCAGRDK